MQCAGPSLRIIAKFTVGVEEVDVDAATDQGNIVTHAPTESNWGGVAEGTMAMMLALLKKVCARDEAMKAGQWRGDTPQGTYLGRHVSDGYALYPASQSVFAIDHSGQSRRETWFAGANFTRTKGRRPSTGAAFQAYTPKPTVPPSACRSRAQGGKRLRLTAISCRGVASRKPADGAI